LAIIASFLVVAGVPFLVAAGLDGIHMPRLAKVAVFASVPAAAVIIVSRPLDLTTDLGLPVILFIVVSAWLFGFAIGPLVRGILSSAFRFARHS